MNMYIQCMYMVRTCLCISRYKHVCTSFRRVCTCFDIYKHILLFTNTYIPCLNLYIPVCTADVRCSDSYVHYMKCTYTLRTPFNSVHTPLFSFGFSFLNCPAGWPVGCDWLLRDVTPKQVQAHYFNWHHEPPALSAFLVPFPGGAAASSMVL